LWAPSPPARVSLAPELGEAVDGLAIDFVLTRSVRDSATGLDAIAGNIQGDPYWAPPAPPSWLAASLEKPKRLRIAVSFRKLDGNALHPDCEAAVRQAAKLCEELGHIVKGATPAFDLGTLVPSFITLWTANLATAIDYIARVTRQTPAPDLFEGLTWGMEEAGNRGRACIPPSLFAGRGHPESLAMFLHVCALFPIQPQPKFATRFQLYFSTFLLRNKIRDYHLAIVFE